MEHRLGVGLDTVVHEDYAAFVASVIAERPLPVLEENLSTGVLREPISFIVAVNDPRECERHIHSSASLRSVRHEWLCIDNVGNRRYTAMARLYSEAMERASHDLCFFLHQDVFLPPDWEGRLHRALGVLESVDPNWGVVGSAGCVTMRAVFLGRPKRRMLGHWADPHGLFRKGLLPARVEILDEMILGVRRSHGLCFDVELPGFHHYGTDLCLSARALGQRCYAMDAPVIHKLFAPDGKLIRDARDSHKLAHRSDVKSGMDFQAGVDFVERKWRNYLPLYSPCHFFVKPG